MSYSNTSEGTFLGGCSCFTQSCIQAGSVGKTREDENCISGIYNHLKCKYALLGEGWGGFDGITVGKQLQNLKKKKIPCKGVVCKGDKSSRRQGSTVHQSELTSCDGSTCCWLMKNRCNRGACKNYCTDCEIHTMTKSWLFPWYGWAGLQFEIRVNPSIHPFSSARDKSIR